MELQLSEEHLMIRQAARDFAVNECLPGVIERDENQKFPNGSMGQLAGATLIMAAPISAASTSRIAE